MPNGAQALIRTLVDAGVTTCFTNPGTSEIHFVAALDSVPEMRAILTCSRASRPGPPTATRGWRTRPAATLLHLGPGLGNGLANLHNARRAQGPGGQHRRRSRDVPRAVRHPAAVRHRDGRAQRVGVGADVEEAPKSSRRDAVEAIAAATGPPGQVATLIVPADVSWQDGAEPAAPPQPACHRPVSGDVIERRRDGNPRQPPDRDSARGQGPARARPHRAARIAAATGTKLFAERNLARLERGAGLPAVERLAYWPELVSKQLDGLEHLILAGATAPARPLPTRASRARLVPPGLRGARALAAAVRRADEPRGVGGGA